MNVKSKITACACVALFAVPASAFATKPANPGSQGKGDASGQGQNNNNGNGPSANNGAGHSQRCKHSTVSKAFVASGTFGAGGMFTASKNADGTYSGTISFTVNQTNHPGSGAKPPFTLTNAKVTFDSPTATAPVASDDVKVIGKIVVVVKKGCHATGGQITIQKVVFSAHGQS